MSLASQLGSKPRDLSIQHKAPAFKSKDEPKAIEVPQETLPMDESDEAVEEVEEDECEDDEDTEQIIHDAAAERTDAYLREFGESIIVLATNRFLVNEKSNRMLQLPRNHKK
jgi:hypothetical protein